MYTLQNPIMNVKHFLMALLFSNEISLTLIFPTNSNRFGLDHKNFLTNYLMLQMIFFHKLAPHYKFIETTYFLIIQKNHFCTLTYEISCAFQTEPILTFQNQLNMRIVPLPLLIPMNP